MLMTISGLTLSNSATDTDSIREVQIENENYKDSIIREYVCFISLN